MTIIDLLIRVLPLLNEVNIFWGWLILILILLIAFLWILVPVFILDIRHSINQVVRAMKEESRIHMIKLDKIADELRQLSSDTAQEEK